MKKEYFISALILIMILPVLTGCMQGRTANNTISGLEASEQSNKNQPATISVSENNTSEDMNQNNIENSDEPLWAQPVEEHGQLFTGLNLDGIGDHDDEAYVSLYDWDHNGLYDASQLVVRMRLCLR